MLDRFPRVAPFIASWISPNLRAFATDRQLLVWLVSPLLGLAVAVASIAFRELVGGFQVFWLGTRSERVLAAASVLPWYWIMAGPLLGGLVVGVLLKVLKAGRTGGVADIIEARADAARELSIRDGLLSAVVAALSLGAGGSAGREGPAVHLGATLAAFTALRLRLPQWSYRALLGAGAAAAIAASFNAPIAGVLFAHEVILGHYSRRALVPIVIASATGGVASRLWFGSAAAFAIPDLCITSPLEFPAFALLGAVAAIVAIFFQLALLVFELTARKIRVALWLQPALGGLLVGAIGVAYPQVLGVGYDVMGLTLQQNLPPASMAQLVVIKTIATAITLAARLGGGIFSPALLVGALTGASFGALIASVFPALPSSGSAYAILGAGAVAGAVLGAPISTTIIVFELTAGYALSVALLLTVTVAHGIVQATLGRSWFDWQLEMRGVFLHGGPHRAMGRVTLVKDFMELHPSAWMDPQYAQPDAPRLQPGETLETALRSFDRGGHARLPVVDAHAGDKVIGWATRVAALKRFNSALVQLSEEEHR